MATPTVLNVETRKIGKGSSRSLRLEKKIPAVIYGPNIENKNVYIDELFVVRHSSSRFESTIFDTQSPDKDMGSLKVMLKKIQHHPKSGRPIHVDLYALDMKHSIRVNVTIKFNGEPVGIKEGGVRQIILREIEVECNPSEIPEMIEVDVSHLEVGTSIHVSDMVFPAGVKPMTALERTVITVNLPKEEKVEPVVEAAAATATAAAPAAAAAAPAKK